MQLLKHPEIEQLTFESLLADVESTSRYSLWSTMVVVICLNALFWELMTQNNKLAELAAAMMLICLIEDFKAAFTVQFITLVLLRLVGC